MNRFRYELVVYYIEAGEVLRSTTGEVFRREAGPFCVSVKGACLRGSPLTDAEVAAYAVGMHGVLPSRVERLAGECAD